jgi:hypothetical protein
MRPAVALFAIAAVIQWLLPLMGVWQHERVIRHGAAVRVRCTAPDPFDPLRGRYLTVRPEDATLPKPDDLPTDRPIPVWATLVADTAGLSKIESISLVPVAGPTVVKLSARVLTRDPDHPTVIVQWPIQRYYLNERLAPDADAIVAERLRTDARPVAELRILEGRAVLTDVLLDGVPIREVAKRRAR